MLGLEVGPLLLAVVFATHEFPLALLVALAMTLAQLAHVADGAATPDVVAVGAVAHAPLARACGHNVVV